MTEELEQELRMLGVLDHKTPAVEYDEVNENYEFLQQSAYENLY